MKTSLLLSLILSSFSFAQQVQITNPTPALPDSVTLANGSIVSREEYDCMIQAAFDYAWEQSFGKMTQEEHDLLFGVPMTISVEIEGEQPVDDTDLYMKEKATEKSIAEPKKTAITPPSPNG
jgi:hypothetical protein